MSLITVTLTFHVTLIFLQHPSLMTLARATVIYVENFQFAEKSKILMYNAHKFNQSNKIKTHKNDALDREPLRNWHGLYSLLHVTLPCSLFVKDPHF